MLLPYNVDRPTKQLPLVTYTLIGLNVFVFLMTLMVANTNLPADRTQAKRAVEVLLEKDSQAQQIRDSANSPDAAQVFEDNEDEELISLDQKMERALQYRALSVLSDKIGDAQSYQQFWQIQHMNDSFVLEPHYSVLNVFAYRVSEESPIWKTIGLFGSMFLHGSFDHLLGNMLFLWVFGRALEEFLGQKWYLGAYLICGVAATLLFHVITQMFSPGSAGVPLMGASGAIAGVLGLFAVRFYRTKVRVLYILPWASIVFFIGWFVAALLLFMLIRQLEFATVLGAVAAIAALLIWGRVWAWGAFRAPSIWVIGVWVVIFNLVPALRELFSGEKDSPVAYWAHLGGFACGALYAFMLGGVESGKSEYLLEDAEAALHQSDANIAVQRAQQAVEREAQNPAALEVLAKAFARQQNFAAAGEHYFKAIELSLKANDRQNAAHLYLLSLGHTPLALSPAQLLAIGGQLAQNANWQCALDVVTRIYTEFPEAPETEIALFRAAQISARGLDNQNDAIWLFNEFLRCFPHSDYVPQAQTGLEAAQRAAN